MDNLINIGSGYKILILEDEPNVAKLLEITLRRDGFNCLFVKNGIEAVDIIDDFRPDLILCDIMMPGMDGYEFRRYTLNDPYLKKIPFVFLTAKGSDEDILKGYNLEIEEYILKTASPKVIVAKITAVLKSNDKSRTQVVDEIQKAVNNTHVVLVPESIPVFQGFRLDHWNQPFKNIPGGDLIDYIHIGNNLFVVLGDVMGKKWNAWYFAYAYAGYIRTTIKSLIQTTPDLTPGDILYRLNKIIIEDDKVSEVFITLSVILLKENSPEIIFSGAGDLPLFKKENNNALSSFNSGGVLLGLKPDAEYTNTKIMMNYEDSLILFTDGITESNNQKDEMYGMDRLRTLLTFGDYTSNIIKLMRADLNLYTGGNLSDDASIVTIKFNKTT